MIGRSNWFLNSALLVGLAFLYIPISVLIAYSFNASPLVSVWGGFSFRWYTELMHNRLIGEAAWLSLKLAAVSSTGALIFGTFAAIALVRFPKFLGRMLLVTMVTAPLVMPEMITGLTQLLLYISLGSLIGWPAQPGWTTLLLSHVTFCIAYVAVTVRSRLEVFDLSIEEAAMDLGSGPVRAFVDITLPIITPALISSWLLCFTISLDDLVISSFVAGSQTITLPMVLYSKIRLGVSPDANALATIVIGFVGACILLAGLKMVGSERPQS